MIEPRLISLLDLVPWTALCVMTFFVITCIWQRLRRNRTRKLFRHRRRSCVQCGLLDKVPRRAPKFGVCQRCGGVTSRGRSRKLG